MPRLGSTSLAFPDFRGATRRLVLWNLGAYFALALGMLLAAGPTERVAGWLVFVPQTFLHGWLWQPLSYSFIHPAGAIFETAMELLSLWFLAGFLEGMRGDGWVMGLYGVSVVGTALTAVLVYLAGAWLHMDPGTAVLTGCFGGIFGLLVAIGVLFGEMEFLLFPLPIGIKAKYLAIIYGLVSIAMLFTSQRMYAFAELGGALAGWWYIRRAPGRGFAFGLSERLYGLRNRYYRWKRRRTARKFEVYMKKQGRTVRFDGQGNRIDEDDDKKRWN